MKASRLFQRFLLPKGFTLIETLIAILITTVVVGVLYTSFFQIMRSRDKIIYDLDTLNESQIILDRLYKDLSNLFPRGRVSLVSKGYNYPYFLATYDGENSQLFFSSFTRDPNTYTKGSDQAEVKYFLIPRREEGIHFLMRSENPWIGNEKGGFSYPLSERVVSFKLNFINQAYLTAINPEPIREWNSSIVNAYPKAVEIVLTLRDKDGKDVTSKATVFLPISE